MKMSTNDVCNIICGQFEFRKSRGDIHRIGINGIDGTQLFVPLVTIARVNKDAFVIAYKEQRACRKRNSVFGIRRNLLLP